MLSVCTSDITDVLDSRSVVISAAASLAACDLVVVMSHFWHHCYEIYSWALAVLDDWHLSQITVQLCCGSSDLHFSIITRTVCFIAQINKDGEWVLLHMSSNILLKTVYQHTNKVRNITIIKPLQTWVKLFRQVRETSFENTTLHRPFPGPPTLRSREFSFSFSIVLLRRDGGIPRFLSVVITTFLHTLRW